MFRSTLASGDSKTQWHRGPDDTARKKLGICTMEFCRLSVNDMTGSGMQPFKTNNSMLMCNGEIYNHKDFAIPDLSSGSDCEVLLPLIESKGIFRTSTLVRGVFAMVYTDGKKLLASRDPLGVRPLFYCKLNDDGGMAFGSEMKSLLQFGKRVEIFPPGHVYDSTTDSFSCYYPCYWDARSLPPLRSMRDVLCESVRIRVKNTDRPVAFLLSGGLDSSLIASIASKIVGPIKTFCIGSDDSTDAKAADRVARHIGSDHTRVDFDLDCGVDALSDVIKSLESYDTTTIRASVPMWLLCRHISRNTPYKVILSGEGSDELLGGYMYFHMSPGNDEFMGETIRRLKLLHQFDVLRADRCSSGHGLELRVPFLDKEVVQVGMEFPIHKKRTKVEKAVLRSEFEGYLPDDILWRRKEAFSDAVGYSWVDHVKAHAEHTISDEQFTETCSKCTHNVPQTKEEALYRRLYWDHFGDSNDHLISEIWRPKWTSETDPSARKLDLKFYDV